jgi:hypothetical protein
MNKVILIYLLFTLSIKTQRKEIMNDERSKNRFDRRGQDRKTTR